MIRAKHAARHARDNREEWAALGMGKWGWLLVGLAEFFGAASAEEEQRAPGGLIPPLGMDRVDRA